MLGSAVAILCAFTWSVSVILFKKGGATVHPVLLNLCKNTLGLLLIVPTVWAVEGSLLPPIPTRDMAILLVSGLLGIGLADAMVLKALQEIGAARIAVVECIYSPFVIFLSVLFLGESLTGARLVGSILVIAALFVVSLTPQLKERTSGNVLAGVRWGVLGILLMAAGIVMVKPIFPHAPLFWIIAVRLTAGVAASAALFALLDRKKDLLRELVEVERKGLVLGACILSTYVSMMLWVAGYKFQDASIAAVLNQTSTVFTVLLAALVLKEKFTPAKIAGTLLAVVGVVVMTVF